jgi:hypothetical protein
MPGKGPRGRLRVLTWHVHGNYLWYLSQCPHDFFVPFRPGRGHGYGGRSEGFPWPPNLHEVPADEVRRQSFDVVAFQSHRNWLVDQHEILSDAQRRLPRLCVEHDPPLEHPVDQRHVVDDPDVLVVHVTPFNALAWDAGRSPTMVIDHGVVVPPEVAYTGEIARGIVAINHLRSRGRRLGADLFLQARGHVPLDLVGLDAESLGGLGAIPPTALRAFEARYRFLFHPSRWSSLGLAVIEAMSIGMPVVALATTEMPTVIEDGVQGFVGTDLGRLVEGMRYLLDHPAAARAMGAQARVRARERFHIRRFVDDWDHALRLVAGVRRRRAGGPAATALAGTKTTTTTTTTTGGRSCALASR